MQRFACSTLCLALLTLTSAAHAADARKPNIILIYADDLGIGDVSCYGGALQTPRVDALAKSGTRFELCYATPLCGPSRCETLTGRYPFRTGLINNASANAVDPKREVMIPTVMKQAGYVTGSCGKWGQICLGPGEWGFDEWLVFPGSGKYWSEQRGGYKVNGQQKKLPAGEYLPDVMHQWVVDFLTKHRDHPFFLYYPMSHVHGPILRTPDSKPGADEHELYRDNVAYMDKLVGKLIDELERLGLRQNTLVVFTGDNGTARFGADLATVDGKRISGQKNTMLEGGSRVPLIASWPGVTPAGAVSHDLIDFSDFFATFAELGAAPLPPAVKLDSHSFAPQLRGEQGDPRKWVYVELNGKSYARDERYKLFRRGAMFDLKNAPWEEIPVAADDAAAAASRTKLRAVLDERPAARPAVKPKKPKAAKQAA